MFITKCFKEFKGNSSAFIFEVLHVSLNILEFVKLLNFFGFGVFFPYMMGDAMATDMNIFAPNDEAFPSSSNPHFYLPNN